MRENYQKVRQLIEAKIFENLDLALYQSTAPALPHLPHYVNTIHFFTPFKRRLKLDTHFAQIEI